MTPFELVQAVPADPASTYRVGGSYRITSAPAGIGVHGSFVVLDPPGLIELTWVWEDDDPVEDRVEVRISGVPGGCEVLVRHEVADEGSLEGLRQGWSDCLARLPAAVGG